MSNEITAYFKGTAGVAESVYQYDYGMILVIDGLDLTSAFEVHFEHTGAVPAVTEIGENNRVAIPNECLALPGKVTAYIYEHTGSHDGETAYVVRFQVMNRARPEYVETTPAQDSMVSKAIAALSNVENKVMGKVNNKLKYKVNSPLDEYNQISNGKPGQILRTKGTGATEWVDQGLPTDEQTAQAVSDWLDDHPEATTTVQDGAIGEAKLSFNLKNKLFNWYKMENAESFGVVFDIKLPIINSYCDGCCYDSKRNKICVVAYAASGSGYNAYILVLDGDNYSVERTEYYSIGRPNAMTYDPVADKLYVYCVSPSEKQVIINPETMDVVGELSLSKPLAYDSVTGKFVSIHVNSNGTMSVTEYDSDFKLQNEYLVTVDTNNSPVQGFACHNRTIYMATWECIFEIDVLRDRIHIVKLKGYGIGLAEPEQLFFKEDDIFMLCHVAGVDGFGHILKYGISNAYNLSTLHTYSRKILQISSVLSEYPTLFDFVSNVPAGTSYVLYGYGASVFSDIPKLFSGSAYTTNIIVEKPINDLGYAQIEVTLVRANTSINMWKRYRGIIKTGSATEITWVQYGMNQAVNEVTFDTSYVTPAKVYCEQINHLCAITFAFVAKQAIPGGTCIATNLPKSMAENIPAFARDNSATAKEPFHFNIGSDGRLKLQSEQTIPEGDSLRFSAAYFARSSTDD